MAKKEVKVEENVVFAVEAVEVKNILPITDLFGNGELNVLKDKINEIIARS